MGLWSCSWVFHHPSYKWLSAESHKCWLPPKDNLPRERRWPWNKGPLLGWGTLPPMQHHHKWQTLAPAWGCLQGRAQMVASACSFRGSLEGLFLPEERENYGALSLFRSHYYYYEFLWHEETVESIWQMQYEMLFIFLFVLYMSSRYMCKSMLLK